ncbi:MAG: hypothetical protein HYS51_00830 [Candidatus Zambryskibacteria bacterium]|nr:hypothetical protein [Candidatus Zambryskibacteria bacterium]
MSLILDALSKAKSLLKKKPAPTLLASFRFGPTRAQKIRKIMLLYVAPGLLLSAVLAMTVNFWVKRLSRPESKPATIVEPLVAELPSEQTETVFGTVTISNDTLPAQEPAKESSDSEAGKVTVGREWTKPISIPIREELVWERADTIAYEAMSQSGEIHRFPRDLKGHVKFSGPVVTLKFRVIDEKKDRVVINYRFYPIR